MLVFPMELTASDWADTKFWVSEHFITIFRDDEDTCVLCWSVLFISVADNEIRSCKRQGALSSSAVIAGKELVFSTR